MATNQRSRILAWCILAVLIVCVAGLPLIALGYSAREAERPNPSLRFEATTRHLTWGDRYYYGGMPKPRPVFPSEITVLTNTGYVVGYCEARMDPAWVCYRLSEVASFHATPRPKGFVVDLRTHARVTTRDYANSGYDRGHMAPNYAIALCYGAQAQQETFLMSNIIPQRPNLNRRVWEQLEQAEVKNYAQRFKQLWVIAGPVFRGDAKRLEGGVLLPDACFKILIVEVNQRPHMLAFIMPQSVSGAELPQQFLTSVAEIENRTGLTFFPDLPKEIEERTEVETAKQMW